MAQRQVAKVPVTVGGHAVDAALGDGLDNAFLGTAVEPDLVGQIRRQADHALAVGTVAGRASLAE
jgi:hypothetical protein